MVFGGVVRLFWLLYQIFCKPRRPSAAVQRSGDWLSRHHCSGSFILTQDSCCPRVRSSISDSSSGSMKRSNSSSSLRCRLRSNDGGDKTSFGQRLLHSLHATLIVLLTALIQSCLSLKYFLNQAILWLGCKKTARL